MPQYVKMLKDYVAPPGSTMRDFPVTVDLMEVESSESVDYIRVVRPGSDGDEHWVLLRGEEAHGPPDDWESCDAPTTGEVQSPPAKQLEALLASRKTEAVDLRPAGEPSQGVPESATTPETQFTCNPDGKTFSCSRCLAAELEPGRACAHWDGHKCADCPGVPELDAGRKFDGTKPQYTLLPVGPLLAVVEVLTYGAAKYSPDNWKHVPDGRRRYLDATFRHIEAWRGGEQFDDESGMHHLAHAICCLFFLMAGFDDD